MSMERAEFLREVKNGDFDANSIFFKKYYRFFSDLDDEGRRRMLGPENCERIGEALSRERNAAYRLIEEGKLNVEMPGGYMIKRHPPGEKRRKFAALIPEGTPRKVCLKMLNEIFGVADVVLRPPRADKRTKAEIHAAQEAKDYEEEDVPF